MGSGYVSRIENNSNEEWIRGQDQSIRDLVLAKVDPIQIKRGSGIRIRGSEIKIQAKVDPGPRSIVDLGSGSEDMR